MKKHTIKGYFVLAVIFVVFSVVAFAPPIEKNSVFWVAYIFGGIAIVSQIYFFKMALLGNTVKSKFYGFPIARVGTVYLIAQIMVCIIEIFMASFAPVWPFIILNVIIADFAAIGCVSTEMVREEIEHQDRELKVEVSSMRELQSLIISLVGQCNSDEIKLDLSKLADAFKFSDPVSNDATIEHEKEIRELLIELQDAVLDDDAEFAKKLLVKVRISLMERNSICKLNK